MVSPTEAGYNFSVGFRDWPDCCAVGAALRLTRVHLDTATIWSAPAERSGDGALAPRACLATLKAVSRSACHRTPHIPHTTNWVVVARCTHHTLAFNYLLSFPGL